MKAQFKYSFRAGLTGRGPAFAVIILVNLVFIVLGLLQMLPIAALITAVSLSGTAIAVMMAFNIVGDVTIARRMFTAPGAYLHALTPAPRKNILLSSIVTMMVMDIVTMALTILSVIILSFNLASYYIDGNIMEYIRAGADGQFNLLSSTAASIAAMITGYLMFLLLILFCVAMRKSVFYNKPAGGLLSVILAFVIVYVMSLSFLLLAPFGIVSRIGVFFTISVSSVGIFMFALLLLLWAAALFMLTSKLMERKINI